MSRRSSFRSFPSIHALTLGLAAGTFALLSGYEGRVALGAETPMGRIIGMVGDGAVVPTAVPAAVPAGWESAGGVEDIDGLRPVADQLRLQEAAEYSKTELLDLAAAAGLDVAKSWTKARIYSVITDYATSLGYAVAA